MSDVRVSPKDVKVGDYIESDNYLYRIVEPPSKHYLDTVYAHVVAKKSNVGNYLGTTFGSTLPIPSNFRIVNIVAHLLNPDRKSYESPHYFYYEKKGE